MELLIALGFLVTFAWIVYLNNQLNKKEKRIKDLEGFVVKIQTVCDDNFNQLQTVVSMHTELFKQMAQSADDGK